MGLMDTLTKEDRISVQFSTLYDIMYEAAKCQLLMNAVNADVPHGYIKGMLTGVKENTIASDEISSIGDVAEVITKANVALGISVGDTEVDD